MFARRSDAGAGRFVVIVGPDGVGKTSVATALMDLWGGPTAYFHFCPPIRGKLDSRPAPGTPAGPKWPDEPGSVVAGWVRLARNVARFAAGYLGSVRPAVRRGSLVVADRYFYGYLVQPRALRFHGPRRLAELATRLVPQPDLIVNLAAPPEVIRGRKAELTIDEIEDELRGWSRVGGDRASTFDAVDSPEEIASRVMSRLVGTEKGAAR